MILETPRLTLRPFLDRDAEDVYAYAKDPRVGPAAGWPPHTSVENSLDIIRTVFSAPNVFALVDKQSTAVIGSAGFVGRHRTELPGPDEELGYALSPRFWGLGLMSEAARELIRFGFEDLGLRTIWCNHYDGNERSRRVIEACGFSHQFSQQERVERMEEVRLTHYYALVQEDWAARQAVRE